MTLSRQNSTQFLITNPIVLYQYRSVEFPRVFNTQRLFLFVLLILKNFIIQEKTENNLKIDKIIIAKFRKNILCQKYISVTISVTK